MASRDTSSRYFEPDSVKHSSKHSSSHRRHDHHDKKHKKDKKKHKKSRRHDHPSFLEPQSVLQLRLCQKDFTDADDEGPSSQLPSSSKRKRKREHSSSDQPKRSKSKKKHKRSDSSSYNDDNQNDPLAAQLFREIEVNSTQSRDIEETPKKEKKKQTFCVEVDTKSREELADWLKNGRVDKVIKDKDKGKGKSKGKDKAQVRTPIIPPFVPKPGVWDDPLAVRRRRKRSTSKSQQAQGVKMNIELDRKEGGNEVDKAPETPDLGEYTRMLLARTKTPAKTPSKPLSKTPAKVPAKEPVKAVVSVPTTPVEPPEKEDRIRPQPIMTGARCRKSMQAMIPITRTPAAAPVSANRAATSPSSSSSKSSRRSALAEKPSEDLPAPVLPTALPSPSPPPISQWWEYVPSPSPQQSPQPKSLPAQPPSRLDNQTKMPPSTQVEAEQISPGCLKRKSRSRTTKEVKTAETITTNTTTTKDTKKVDTITTTLEPAMKTEPSPKRATRTTATKSEYFKKETKAIIPSPTKSKYFNNDSPSRPAKNTSCIIPPPLDAKRFGLIQEEVADNPSSIIKHDPNSIPVPTSSSSQTFVIKNEPPASPTISSCVPITLKDKNPTTAPPIISKIERRAAQTPTSDYKIKRPSSPSFIPLNTPSLRTKTTSPIPNTSPTQTQLEMEYLLSLPRCPTSSVSLSVNYRHTPSPPPAPKNELTTPPPPPSPHLSPKNEEEEAAYHLLTATIFLNKVRGSYSIPYFRRFIKLYPTPQSLLEGSSIKQIEEFMKPLGLQTHRAKNVWGLARSWCKNDPYDKTKGEVGWTRKSVYKPREVRWCVEEGEYGVELEEEEEEEGEQEYEEKVDIRGKVEEEEDVKGDIKEEKKGKKKKRKKKQFGCIIGHLEGIGCYALDSWRIFCQKPGEGGYFYLPPPTRKKANLTTDDNDEGGSKDVLSTIHDNDAKEEKVNMKEEEEQEVEKEWKKGDEEWRRVMPADKELRAYLKWMWQKEGVVWRPIDMETGEVLKMEELGKGLHGLKGDGVGGDGVGDEKKVEGKKVEVKKGKGSNLKKEVVG